MLSDKIKKILALKLKKGCLKSAEFIKQNTPIDTQRLYESVNVSEPKINENIINVKIILGGQDLYGVRREQNIKRPVNYAIYVESRSPFIRPLLGQITQELKDTF